MSGRQDPPATGCGPAVVRRSNPTDAWLQQEVKPAPSTPAASAAACAATAPSAAAYRPRRRATKRRRPERCGTSTAITPWRRRSAARPRSRMRPSGMAATSTGRRRSPAAVSASSSARRAERASASAVVARSRAVRRASSSARRAPSACAARSRSARQRGLDLRHALALDHDGGLGLHARGGVALDLLARSARGDRQLAGELGQRMVAGVARVGAHAQLLDLAAQHGDGGQRGRLGGQAPRELLADRQGVGLGVAHGGARLIALGDDVAELVPQRVELGLGVEQPARGGTRAQIDDARLVVVGRERGFHRGGTVDPPPDGSARAPGQSPPWSRLARRRRASPPRAQARRPPSACARAACCPT